MNVYKTLIYVESLFTSVVPGYTALNCQRLTRFLNEHARQGWEVVSITPVDHRSFLFIKHTAYAIVMKKEPDTDPDSV